MAKKSDEKKNFILSGMTVANVRRLSEKVVAFSLLGNGLGLYNLRIVDGQKAPFVAAPQEKGKDGKYYNVYALYLSRRMKRRSSRRYWILYPKQKKRKAPISKQEPKARPERKKAPVIYYRRTNGKEKIYHYSIKERKVTFLGPASDRR